MKGIGELCSQVNSGAMAGACRPMIRGPAGGGGFLRLSWEPTSVAGLSHRVAGRVVLRRLWRTLRRSSRSFHPVEVSLGTRRAASSLYAGTACSPCNPLAGRRVRPARGVALYCTGGVTGVPFRHLSRWAASTRSKSSAHHPCVGAVPSTRGAVYAPRAVGGGRTSSRHRGPLTASYQRR